MGPGRALPASDRVRAARARDDAGRGAELADEARRARAALGQLRPEQRRVLELAIDRGLTHEEIARTTGLPLGTVKTHARRGLIRLRELLQEPPPGGAPDAAT